jgi:uncharacterized membrane protein
MKIRRYFITGLVVLAPTVITGWLVWKIFITVDNVIEPFQKKFPVIDVPGLGVAIVVVIVFLIGFVASHLVGRRIISAGESLLKRLPMVRSIYSASKELSEIFLAENKAVFKRVVLIRFPHPGSRALAFVMNEDSRYLNGVIGSEVVTVFLATTPNPTTGFMLVVPKSETTPVDISIEEAIKMVISGGAFMPHLLSEIPAPRT